MESLVGSLIGPYCITRPVGHGGLGSVFEATHQQIGRRVAIKILRSEHARDQEAVTRLFNEARAVNRIEHPGLVQIFDCDRLPDGRAYLVMEFLQGPTLTERLDSCGGKLPELDALRITHQLASILAITHAGGIIHRDLKSKNMSREIQKIRDGERLGNRRKNGGLAVVADGGADGF
jgi:serine/threonine-protein kinase